MRTAILVSVIPGLLATVAILYAIRRIPKLTVREHQPIRLRVRPVMQGQLGRLMLSVSAFEMGNVAATLLILRATEVLTPSHGLGSATQIGLLLYVAYNVSATLFSFPAGHVSDRIGPVRVFGFGAAAFLIAYVLLALTGSNILALAMAFVLAGLGIACAETAQSAAVAASASAELRGAAFGLLAAVQSFANLAASAVAGVLWTLVSPMAAFAYLGAWMAFALGGLILFRQPQEPSHRRAR